MKKYNNIVILISVVWNIEYYQPGTGKYPVEEFINSLDTKSRARIARTLDLLEEFGISLEMPYARHLESNSGN